VKKQKSLKSKKELISREIYNKILYGLELEQIILIDAKASFEIAKINLPEKSGNIDVDPKENVKVSFEDKNLIGTHGLKLIGKIKDQKLFEISCTFVCLFKSKEKLSKEFAERFKQRNLRIYTVPYLREFIQNMSLRMCMPPLVLPMYKR